MPDTDIDTADALAASRKRHFQLDRRAEPLYRSGLNVGNPDDLLSTKQVAVWLQVSPAFLEVMRSKGGPSCIPFVRLAPTRIRYKRADVLAWLAARTFAFTGDYPKPDLA